MCDPQAFVVYDAYGPLRAAEIERVKQRGGQLVRSDRPPIGSAICRLPSGSKELPSPTALMLDPGIQQPRLAV